MFTLTTITVDKALQIDCLAISVEMSVCSTPFQLNMKELKFLVWNFEIKKACKIYVPKLSWQFIDFAGVFFLQIEPSWWWVATLRPLRTCPAATSVVWWALTSSWWRLEPSPPSRRPTTWKWWSSLSALSSVSLLNARTHLSCPSW